MAGVIDVVAAVILKFAKHGALVTRADVEKWHSLAQAREDLSARGGGAEWLEVSDNDRIDAVIEARSWLQAARDAGLAA